MNQIHCYLLSLWQRFYFEMTFTLVPDPWQHTSPSQQTKYEQTLKLLPFTPLMQVLELGCGEGYLTVPLAARADNLIAADISQLALRRAAKSCATHQLENVSFQRLDLTLDPLPDNCDLIVCSEVLYYVSGQVALEAVARKLIAALKPGGYLLTSHYLRVDSEPDRTSFDWLLPFGAVLIGKTLTSTGTLQLVKEIRAPRYRIQLFQCDGPTVQSPLTPEVIELEQSQLPQRQRSIFDLLSLAFLLNQLQRLVKSTARRNE
jgi:SAM-dependent methyltransferase